MIGTEHLQQTQLAFMKLVNEINMTSWYDYNNMVPTEQTALNTKRHHEHDKRQGTQRETQNQ